MHELIDQLRAIGAAFLEVLRAESEALRADVTLSAKRLGAAVALFGAALVVAFWLVGLLLVALVALLALWLPVWGAALIVTGLLALVVGLLGWIGTKKLRAFEGPARTIGRRLSDHLAWWQSSLLREERPVVTPREAARAAGTAATVEEE